MQNPGGRACIHAVVSYLSRMGKEAMFAGGSPFVYESAGSDVKWVNDPESEGDDNA